MTEWSGARRVKRRGGMAELTRRLLQGLPPEARDVAVRRLALLWVDALRERLSRAGHAVPPVAEPEPRGRQRATRLPPALVDVLPRSGPPERGRRAPAKTLTCDGSGGCSCAVWLALPPDTPASDAAEEWRPIAKYGGVYEVSSGGRVRETATGRIMPRHQTEAYAVVGLKRGKATAPEAVHPLVLTAFRGGRPAGHVAGVANGDWRDVRLENVGWVTRPVGRARIRTRRLVSIESEVAA